MSPIPIIARQRGLSRVGEIRIGGEKPERGAGRKLETFRLTSQHKDIIENCASLYGGTPEPWQSPNGDAWQLYTESSALPTLVILDYSLNQVYERWEGATKCVRRCDGVDEMLAGKPCVCNEQGLEGKEACDIVSRLMVVLYETGTSLGWQLRSTGENAARELSGAMMVAQELARGRAFVPAVLRLTQRRGVVDGQTVRYVVPVLDFNLVAEAQRLAGVPETVGLAPAHTPAPRRELAPVTVQEGLDAAAASGEPKATSGRQAAPIPPAADVDIEFGEPVPVPVDDTPAPAQPTEKLATKPQKNKLGALVGRLRPAHVTTEQLYRGLGRPVPEPGDDGDVHLTELWATLTRAEATELIDRLQALEQRVAA